ncbi:hypothetical protein GGS24DRAFT_373852 [Hypoxylon argillaceum]|nr:hypothetical protein GGS24DRAFT_373852 [Hypoxylon argillaceum]
MRARARTMTALVLRTHFRAILIPSEVLEVGRASRSKRPPDRLSILLLLDGLVRLARLVLSRLVGPARIFTVRLGARLHLRFIFVEVYWTLVVWGKVPTTTLGLAVRALTRLTLHRVPLFVPLAVVSAALHQRHFDFLATWVGFSVTAFFQPVLQLARAVLKTKVNLSAHISNVGIGLRRRQKTKIDNC